jgi:DNA polymerase-3 subunit delta'
VPFAYASVLDHLRRARLSGRLGQAYLFFGRDAEGLRKLAVDVAGEILRAPAEGHPDFFYVAPVSKTRRIRVDQVRDLLRHLLLTPLRAHNKVALVAEADRMCTGSAEAANAFLKMLEEPPKNVVILLTSTEPELLLPTILSRCIRVHCQREDLAAGEEPQWVRQWWEAPEQGVLRGMLRASLWRENWERVREEAKASLDKEELSSEEEQEALLALETRRRQRELLGQLEEAYWKRVCQGRVWEEGLGWWEVLATLRELEAVYRAFEGGLDPLFAMERACFSIEKEQAALSGGLHRFSLGSSQQAVRGKSGMDGSHLSVEVLTGAQLFSRSKAGSDPQKQGG